MPAWVVRAHYPSGDLVEEFDSEAEAQAAIDRHKQQGAAPISFMGPAPPGAVVADGCSFCGKSRSQVARLVAGPTGSGVAICNECVALAAEIVGLHH